MKTSKKQIKPSRKVQPVPIVFKRLANGHMLELIYSPKRETTALGYWNSKAFKVMSTYKASKDTSYIPVSGSNNLIKHGVIKFPSFAEDYGSINKLIGEIRAFIHRYVDLDPDFETVTAHYVLLSWVYDRFNEMPYLRMIGDYGTGKTRFLQIIGSICYKPIFVSGASSMSPIFHSLNSFSGTLILDEADFKFSDAKSDMVKILNNGTVKGFPVLRCEGNSKGQYNPRAFQVFGPKIIATRHHYSDPALESRLITSESKAGSIRACIPLNLPDSYGQEAEALRNKLLMFRFQNWDKISINENADLNVGINRVAQIFRPLLAIAQNGKTRTIIAGYAQKSQNFLKAFRSHSYEEQILSVIAELLQSKSKLSIKAITASYQKKYGKHHINPVTPKWIGGIIRSKLHISTVKRQGVYVIGDSELTKLKALFKRYDITCDLSVDALSAPSKSADQEKRQVE